MNTGRTVFSQLMDYLPTYEFQKCVNRYSGDYRSRNLSCRDHFLAMAFAQFTYRESLRDIETCLRSISGKLYHMGFRTMIARSTLADANESRDWRIYADFAQTLIAIARPLYAHDPIGVGLNQSGTVGLHRMGALCNALSCINSPRWLRTVWQLVHTAARLDQLLPACYQTPVCCSLRAV